MYAVQAADATAERRLGSRRLFLAGLLLPHAHVSIEEDDLAVGENLLEALYEPQRHADGREDRRCVLAEEGFVNARCLIPDPAVTGPDVRLRQSELRCEP